MRRLRASLRRPLAAFGLLLLGSVPSGGAIFPCDVAGFDQAVAASEGGAPSPPLRSSTWEIWRWSTR